MGCSCSFGRSRRHGAVRTNTLATLALLLVLCCSLLPAAVSAAAQCVINASNSGPTGPAISAEVTCSGGANIALGADPSVLASKPTVSGVTWDKSCTSRGCLFTFCGNTPVVLQDSRITGIKIDTVNSIICVIGSSSLNITDSTFADNNARAILAREQAQVTIFGSTIAHNTVSRENGGGIWLGDSARLSLLNSSVNHNKATNGGGLYVSGDARAMVNSSSISDNACASLSNGKGGSGGGVAVFNSGTVVIGGDSRVSGNFANSSGAGVFTTNKASLSVLPGVLFGNNRVHAKAFGYDVAASDKSTLDLPPVDFAGTGTFTTLSNISKCSRGVALDRSPCGVGEVRDNRTGVCTCCPARSYSFNDSGVCQECPAHGACPGGDALQPLPGYWRSSALSEQLHQCPLGQISCAGKDQCHEGYTGPMCAGCKPGYGPTAPLRCAKCLSPRMQLGIYIFISLVTVFFVACTVHFTYKDNVEGSKDMRPSDLIKILVQYLQYHMIIGCVTVPWPAFFGPLFRISETIFGVTSVSSMALPCWVPFYTRAPRDKIPGPVRMQLVMFMAPLLVFLAAVVLRLLWWAVRTGFMALYGGSSGASSAANASSCASPSCVRIMQPPTARLELRKLPVTALIVLFYAYPTLLLTSMMFFACLPIDKAATGSPATLMDNKHGYYQMDMEQPCFMGWHRKWALGLGVPTVFTFALLIPVGMFWLLKANAGRATELRFREHFGFLYRNYKPEKMWWEAVWAVQTVCMAALAAFHFRLGAYYAMLLMCLTFAISAAAQAMFKPYSIQQLHEVHYGSTSCLFLTAMAGLSMFAIDKPAASLARIQAVIAALVMIIDIGFVLWCLFVAFQASRSAQQSLLGKAMSALTGKASRQGSAMSTGSGGFRPPSECIPGQGSLNSQPSSLPPVMSGQMNSDSAFLAAAYKGFPKNSRAGSGSSGVPSRDPSASDSAKRPGA